MNTQVPKLPLYNAAVDLIERNMAAIIKRAVAGLAGFSGNPYG